MAGELFLIDIGILCNNLEAASRPGIGIRRCPRGHGLRKKDVGDSAVLSAIRRQRDLLPLRRIGDGLVAVGKLPKSVRTGRDADLIAEIDSIRQGRRRLIDGVAAPVGKIADDSEIVPRPAIRGSFSPKIVDTALSVGVGLTERRFFLSVQRQTGITLSRAGEFWWLGQSVQKALEAAPIGGRRQPVLRRPRCRAQH